jgi:hypothetical protein
VIDVAHAKDEVFAELDRVLRAGGRLQLAGVVIRDTVSRTPANASTSGRADWPELLSERVGVDPVSRTCGSTPGSAEFGSDPHPSEMTPDRRWLSDLTLTVVARGCLPIGRWSQYRAVLSPSVPAPAKPLRSAAPDAPDRTCGNRVRGATVRNFGTRFRHTLRKRSGLQSERPAFAGLFQAAEGTRTLDLLHGKQTL